MMKVLRHYWEVAALNIESKWRVFSQMGGSCCHYYFDLDSFTGRQDEKATLAQRGNTAGK